MATKYMQPENMLVGAGGCKFIDGAVTGEKFYQLSVDADATITVLLGEDGTDYLASIGLSGKTVTKGTILTISKRENFANVTVTSGSLIGYSVG
tara:strand:- start:261 stop:542 length:282 start_codon:yes stop_codon:yes gene_type:complete